jgi:anti-anti-sigma factor
MVNIEVSQQDRATLVEVSGRIDGNNAHELGGALNEQLDGGRKNLILDLAGLDFMSSAGLRELVMAYKKAKRESGDLSLAQPSERVRDILEMAGLDTVFQIYPTRSAALAGA